MKTSNRNAGLSRCSIDQRVYRDRKRNRQKLGALLNN